MNRSGARADQPPLPDNPYVGPRAYTEAEAPRFYGRERESRDLLALVARERVVLFYAQSGAGKSSLLHARLVPGLRQEGFDVLPVARVSGDAPPDQDRAVIANLYAYNLILSLNQGLPPAARAGAEAMRRARLLTYLAGEDSPALAGESIPALAGEDSPHLAGESTSAPPSPPPSQPAQAGLATVAPGLGPGSAAAEPALAPTVLIIDQFEEILTTHPERWRERRGLFEQLREAMDRLPNLWVVLTLREDYVAPLEVYAEMLPNRLRARFYMQRMGLEAARQAIEAPAASYGRPFAPGVAQTLVDNLSRVRVPGEAEPQPGPYVEPVQLQVVCYQLWENMRLKPPGPIAMEDLPLGYIDQALTRFYEDRLAEALADPAAQQAGATERGLRHWFSHELITAGGIRDTVLRNEETGMTGSAPNAAVDPLARKYLVRLEPRAGGIWVELVHDRFVGPILEANRIWFDLNSDALTQAAQAWRDAGRDPARLFTGSQLAAAVAQMQSSPTGLGRLESEFIERAQEAEAARRARRQRRITIGIGIVAVVFALLTALALWNASRAGRAQGRAEASLRQAAADRDEVATLAANLAAVLTVQAEGELPRPVPSPTEATPAEPGTGTASEPPTGTPTPAPGQRISPTATRAAITRAPVQLPTYGVVQRSTISAVQAELLRSQARQTVAALGVTLYIQVPRGDMTDQARALQDYLRQKGYTVAGVSVTGSGAPEQNEIRYYDERRQAAAEAVQKDLAANGLPGFLPRHVSSYVQASQRDVLEIRFAP